MSPQHGRRVVGDDAYDKAVREEVGGVHTFGVRVRGAIPENGPTNIAKRNTEHGPLVVAGATFQDHKGQEGDGVSIDDLRNILTENPTFFDSLYEAELARPDGAREDALAIFYEVERGIKGQARADVMDEIRTLLGAKRQTAAANADLIKVRLEHVARQQQRMEENALLTDADRIAALADREENVQRAKAAGTEQLTTLSPIVETQLQTIADEQGLDINTTGGAVVGNIPMKPEGDIRPETQQPGEAILTPKADESTASGVGDTDDDDEDEYESMSRAELDREAKKLKIKEEEITGTGTGGRVVRADVLQAVRAKKQEG